MELIELSEAQTEIINLQEYYEDNSINNLAGLLHIEDNLPISKIEQALNFLIKTHESYRLRVKKINSEFKQYISEHKDRTFDVMDFTNDQEGYNHWINEEVTKNIYNNDSDLFKFTILRLPKGNIGVFLLHHHVISDGWSLNISIKTVSEYLINENKKDLLEHTYLDYVKEELNYINSKRYEKDKQFWSEKLQNFEDNELFKSQTVNSAKGDRKSYNLSDIDTHKIKIFCDRNWVSISNLFSTAIIILKYKKTFSEKISIGAILHNRNKQIEKKITGIFSRALPLIVDISSNNSIRDILIKTKNASFNMLKHRKYPYRKIIEDSGNKSGLLDFVVSFQNKQNDSEIVKKGYTDEWIDNGFSNAPIAITISNRNRNNDLDVDYDYQVDVVNEEEVENIHNAILKIIEEIIENPYKQIKDIEVISDTERETILYQFNDTQLPLNNEQTFLERFEQKVIKNPNQTAINYGDESLTYQELNERANQLAHQLRQDGVQPNSLVGIMTNRHLDMIIGIYGILKAGGAYVPIDPAYPSERVNYILKDSETKVLLTDQTLDVSIEFNQTVINLINNSTVATQPTNNLPHVTELSDLMYVIYTSGTTGKPKGVLVSYKGVMNNLNWMINQYHISSDDIILFKSPFTFDASIWEIFSWGLVGAQATLLPSGQEGNPEKITSLIQKSHATMVFFVPSMLNAFINYIQSTKQAYLLSGLEFVFAGGEAVKPELVNLFNENIGNENNTKLINLYGPTETTVEVTHFDCQNHMIYDSIPIGQPIANTQSYIMNEDNNLMGIGMPGELCIGGEAVTDGYLNRPELTQEKFIDNPFGEGKLYRTGDLAMWHKDGNIACLGRIDDQVKIRGYRIEIGEIENVLRQIDYISDVVVLVKPMAGESLALCAYLVSDEQLTLNDIKAKLRDKLPAYMVPAYMTQIEKLPVSSSGKLDKKQLPEIKVESKTYVAPSNEIERIVTGAFETVLSEKRVSIQDNFFEIGGDSLKAIQVTSLLSKSYNISIKDIFELQTIERISAVLLERVDTNIVTKLNSLKEINIEPIHHLDSRFMNEINDYKEKSIEIYKNIDINATKSNKQILLTGATGYLGIHILKNLLESTDSTIYILVRNSKELSGEEKLKNNWLYYFDFSLNSKYLSRILFIEGDIESENLGFEYNYYNYLANNIDLIINIAANVNHFATEVSSYDTNVNAIHNLVSFAKDTKKKEIHHMSTMSIASGEIKNKDSVLFSENDVDLGQKTNNVYTDSKIEAEKLLVAYRNEGVETNIYRLGNLQCDSETGIFQKNEENNATYRVIKALKKLQKFPETYKGNEDFTPVNQAAIACNKLILNTQLHNEIHHIYNKNPLSLKTLMSVYNENNHFIEGVQWNEFIDYLIACIEKNKLSDEVNDFLLHNGILDNTVFNKSQFKILDFKTNFILEKLNFEWKEISTDLLEKMIIHPKNSY
ncbi:amino acid adenylation domain-containing protein [Staphylococcus gallinarum]|uniref:Putative long chain fatty acid-CoA ligase VraA n=1 Tax=Staphylococcus gallinarum TaxID=1293 RepID=A0A3A0VSK6_STAGA|nr:non-ribosomal peptide synthetase [Staphylococcus gallinarum]RIP37330.1 amino acid adenylation domain-containing protein [Staphylococcus gallinarum]